MSLGCYTSSSPRTPADSQPGPQATIHGTGIEPAPSGWEWAPAAGNSLHIGKSSFRLTVNAAS
jgi:hypothetical protein